MFKRVLISLLVSSFVNLGITVLWISSRPFWQYDWQVDGVLALLWPLLVIFGFSAFGVAVISPLLAWLRSIDLDAGLRLLLVVAVAAGIGYLMMSWAPKVAMLGAMSAIITIATLRLVAPALFVRAE